MLVRPQPRRHGDEGQFWEYVQAKELRLQRCQDCAYVRYPPAPVCPSCLSESSGWERMSGEGALLSWVVFHRRYFSELPPPYMVAAVHLTEGPNSDRQPAGCRRASARSRYAGLGDL